MDKLIIGIAVIWGALWLLGVVLNVVGQFLSAVRQQWDRTLPTRERVGHAVGRPAGVFVATVRDHRLMSAGFAVVFALGALILAGMDSRWLVSSLDGMFGGASPLVGWAVAGTAVGVSMGLASRVMELGWLGRQSARLVPDISHLRDGEAAETRYLRLRQIAAGVAAVILAVSIGVSFERNSGYDRKASLDSKIAAVASAAQVGKLSVLNAALEDAVGSLANDPKSGIGILAAIKSTDRESSGQGVGGIAKVASAYIDSFREDTEKSVTDGKADALARSEAFSQIDRIASLKWRGRLYESGKGGASRDLVQAFSLYSDATAAGDKVAAKMMDSVSHAMVSAKEEPVRDAALKYLESKAQSGAPSDSYWVGQWYAKSAKQGDQKVAEKWLVKALTQDTDAKTRDLSFTSLFGLKDLGPAATKALDEQAPKYVKGKDEGMKKAAYAYLEGRAESGDPGSMLWMGYRHQEGDGIPKDAKKAHDWFLKAALQDKNTTVKNKAFEALGETNHPPIEGTRSDAVNESVPSLQSAKAPVSPTVSEQQKATSPTPSRRNTSLAAPPSTSDFGIPPNSHLSGNRGNWVCDVGFFRSGGQCLPVQVPMNASLSYSGNDWSCNTGYFRQGNNCAQVIVPANGSLSYSGHDWVCNNGYFKRGNECVRVDIPSNATLSYSGHDWVCNNGYYKRGNECAQVNIPANGSLSYSGHDWVCNNGYFKRGSECIKVDIPPNATLSYSGHDWVCIQGYRKYGSGCIAQ